jgi:Arc/MetJ-type ribon-helix-helix transcriptional regulator
MTMTLTLSSENAALLERLVESGRYDTVDAALGEALALLADGEDMPADWAAAIDAAEEDFAAGRFVTLSSSEEALDFFRKRREALLGSVETKE